MEALASSKGAGVLGGVGGASKASATLGMSRSLSSGTTSVRKSANGIARARSASGVSATEGSSRTARGGEGRSSAANVDFVSVESAPARRSRWPVERNQEQEHERGEQDLFPEERPVAARDSCERRQEDEEEGEDMRFHRGESCCVSEGGATTAARGGWRQDGGGERIGNNASLTPPVNINVNGSAGHGARQYEGDPGRQPGQAHRWAREEGLGGGGQDARWEEEAGAEGGRRLDSRNPDRPSDGGLPWRAEHAGAAGRDPNGSSGRSATSRLHEGADQPPPGGFRRTHGVDGEGNEPRFGGDGHGRHHDRDRDEKQPGRQQELHYGAASAFSHRAGVEEIGGRQNGEALARDDASYYRDSNSNGNSQALESSWGVRRSTSSPDGVKYDPMRYEKAARVSQGAAAEGGEHGAWAGAHPDPPRGERAGGGGGGMRSVNSDGRQSMRASASAAVATLDRTSPLRHSDAAGMGTGREIHPRFRQALQEGPAASGVSAAAADDAERRQATAGDSGGGGDEVRPQEWERLNGAREGGREVDQPAFTGGRGRHEQGQQQPVNGADEGVGRSAERGGAHVYGVTGEPDAAAADGLNASAGAGGGLPAGSRASGVGGGSGGKVEHVLRDGRRVILFANGTQKVGVSPLTCPRCATGDW